MTSAGTVHEAVRRHVEFWNSQRREDWLALFADDVTFDDPVGAPTKHGRIAAETSWDSSFTPGRRWTLHPQRITVCGDEAAVLMHNVGDLDGRQVSVEGVEIWKVNSAGLVCAVRAYFEQPQDFELSPYFRPTT
jgi:hypothetical protein